MCLKVANVAWAGLRFGFQETATRFSVFRLARLDWGGFRLKSLCDGRFFRLAARLASGPCLHGFFPVAPWRAQEPVHRCSKWFVPCPSCGESKDWLSVQPFSRFSGRVRSFYVETQAIERTVWGLWWPGRPRGPVGNPGPGAGPTGWLRRQASRPLSSRWWWRWTASHRSRGGRHG